MAPRLSITCIGAAHLPAAPTATPTRPSWNFANNAYVVKPMKFTEFVEAATWLGAFWAVLNEAPPGSVVRPMSRGT